MGRLRVGPHLFDRDPDAIPYCRCGLPARNRIHRCPQCAGARYVFVAAEDAAAAEIHPSGVGRIPCPTCNTTAAPAAPDAPNDLGLFDIDPGPAAVPKQPGPYGSENP